MGSLGLLSSLNSSACCHFPLFASLGLPVFGSFAGLIICIIFGFIINTALPFQIIVAGAISGMFIELVPLRTDDNFSIPIFSGFMMQVLKDTL